MSVVCQAPEPARTRLSVSFRAEPQDAGQSRAERGRGSEGGAVGAWICPKSVGRFQEDDAREGLALP